ncbi:MAG TPA: nuclear transport factor 2 family protein [Candidatus Dormibacteraeota bacterium]|jgi:hypothetical protein|nr:nuclear transport factor 2 family protein [Candidatus Dormibacteraeota bacterium]
MTDTISEVLETYYSVLRGGVAAFDGESRLRPILDEELSFEGPIAGRVSGAERFLRGVSGFIQTVREVRMIEQLQAGDRAAALYDADMPGGTVRFAEFFEINGGRIRSLRLLYDAAEYRARGGR